MTDIIDRLWAQIEPDVFITREQFARGLSAWTIEPVEIDGVLAFAVLTKGPEFHFTSFGEGKTITAGMIGRRLAPLLDQYGYIITRTPIEDADRQHRLNRRLGFRAIGEDEYFTTYRLDKPACQ